MSNAILFLLVSMSALFRFVRAEGPKVDFLCWTETQDAAHIELYFSARDTKEGLLWSQTPPKARYSTYGTGGPWIKTEPLGTRQKESFTPLAFSVRTRANDDLRTILFAWNATIEIHDALLVEASRCSAVLAHRCPPHLPTVCIGADDDGCTGHGLCGTDAPHGRLSSVEAVDLYNDGEYVGRCVPRPMPSPADLCSRPELCRPEDGTCRECLNDSDCVSGDPCSPAGKCLSETSTCAYAKPIECEENLRCVPSETDPRTPVCAECSTDADCRLDDEDDASERKWCSPTSICSKGSCALLFPCPGMECDEEGRKCFDCSGRGTGKNPCNDDLWCNGEETCSGTGCSPGTPPCPTESFDPRYATFCSEAARACVGVWTCAEGSSAEDCSDGSSRNSMETCTSIGTCAASIATLTSTFNVTGTACEFGMVATDGDPPCVNPNVNAGSIAAVCVLSAVGLLANVGAWVYSIYLRKDDADDDDNNGKKSQ